MGKNLVIVVLAAALVWCSWLLTRESEISARPPGRDDPHRELFDRVVADLPGVGVGFCLMDEKGTVVSQWNADQAMIPASSFKTLTTIAALDLLGPDFRFRTEVYFGGKTGDLVLRGGGDPTLSIEHLEELADEVVKAGITQIDGGVVGDGRLFPANMAGDFWGWGDVGNGYGSPTSGLNLEHNRFVAVFQPGEKVGEVAKLIEVSPELPGVDWLNEVRTGAAGSGDQVMIYGGPLATRIRMEGTVPLGKAFAVRGAAPNPPLFAAHHLHQALVRKGLSIRKEPRVVEAMEELPEGLPMIQRQSAPLSELLPGLHARSDNHETECLFQMLGVTVGRPAEQVLTDYWRERGVKNVRIVDGSGLSRADFISPQDLARVQIVAARGEHADIYRASLSSMSGGRIQLKGGAMSSVRTWTGYVEDGDGERHGFALMFNHYNDGSELNEWWDALLGEVMRSNY
ncbi:MAG: D-alanyl-D-alanine carboxypeptidase/D-alanyl-D-alanine-endopeptidase [Verrucomicrobiota bacterium]